MEFELPPITLGGDNDEFDDIGATMPPGFEGMAIEDVMGVLLGPNSDANTDFPDFGIQGNQHGSLAEEVDVDVDMESEMSEELTSLPSIDTRLGGHTVNDMRSEPPQPEQGVPMLKKGQGIDPKRIIHTGAVTYIRPMTRPEKRLAEREYEKMLHGRKFPVGTLLKFNYPPDLTKHMNQRGIFSFGVVSKVNKLGCSVKPFNPKENGFGCVKRMSYKHNVLTAKVDERHVAAIRIRVEVPTPAFLQFKHYLSTSNY